MQNCNGHNDNSKVSVATETFDRNRPEKHGAVWTSYSTSLLLKLYELKLDMLETPKKKRRIWIAISDELRDYNIKVTPDQVRWKINALTKKYKKCIDSECHDKFKYFKEMNNIYSQYNVDSDAYLISELLDDLTEKRDTKRLLHTKYKSVLESKRIIELRKIRLANRIESDRYQTKVSIERQWLDYLKKQEHLRLQNDFIISRNLEIKEQKLQLRKRQLEMKQSLEFKKIKIREKELEEVLQIESEKCELLKQLFTCNY